MARLYIEATNTVLGEVTDAELDTLVNNLEEETRDDTDYWITSDTIDFLEARGADAKLIAILRTAVGDSDGLDIRWSH